MRVKLDENLPESIVAGPAALGHDTDTVAGEGLAGATDEDVWPQVQQGRAIPDHQGPRLL
jgi:hypothetical protein